MDTLMTVTVMLVALLGCVSAQNQGGTHGHGGDTHGHGGNTHGQGGNTHGHGGNTHGHGGDTHSHGAGGDHSIHCWQCDTTIPTMTEEGADCFNGTHPFNATKVACPSGKCIIYTADIGGGFTGMMSTSFVRGCVDAEMESSGYCNGTMPLIKEPECCMTDYCNGPMGDSAANAIVVNFVTVFVSSLLLFALIY